MSTVNNIPEGWVETTLRELAHTNQNCIDRNYNFKEISYLDTGSITEGVIDSYQVMNYSESPSRAKRLVKDGDIVYSSVRPNLKHYGFIRNPHNNLVVSTGFVVISSKVNHSSKFLYYWLTQDSNTNYLHQLAEQSTSTYPSIKPTDLENLKIALPINISEQKSIAAILTSFDDKIELLHAQNKTLEETAQTIFKEWFGKYQIGDELPEGWRVGKLGEEFDISIGRTPPRLETEWFSKVPVGKKWISIKDIGNSGIYIDNTSEYLTDEAIKKFNIPIIPKNTTILSFKMTVGKLTITTEDMLSNEAIAHLKIKTNSVLSSEFIYLYLQKLDFNALGSTSSIVTAINSTMIKELEIIVPDSDILKRFNQVILSLFNKIRTNSTQIQTLTQTRDELLPKLMSGDIRVNDFNG